MSNNPTIFSLQMLRAFAAGIVVIAHAQVHLHVRGLISELNPLLDLGRVGVDLFFIISGFIMVYIANNKFTTPGASRNFIVKRFIRVVPIYWIYTFALSTLMILLPQLVSHGKSVGIEHFIASLFFVPWENNIGHIKPVLAVGWTLNFEIYFYLVFAILLFFPKRYFLILLSIILLSGVLLGVLFKSIPTPMYVMTSPLLLEFLLGCIIGTIYLEQLRSPKWLAYLLTILGIMGLIYSINDFALHTQRFIKWGIPSGLLIMGILFLEKIKAIPISYLLVKLGDSSYSLYLTHIFTINALGKIWVMLFNDYFFLYIFSALIISPIIGHLAYLLLEKPIITIFSRKNKEY
jgi:peptidoglycan/LPS O-acetylase OafA/YrhL